VCTRARARVHVRARGLGWRVNRTLAPRRRLEEAWPRAPAIERAPFPDLPCPPLASSFPPCHLSPPLAPLPPLFPAAPLHLTLPSSHLRLFPHHSSHTATASILPSLPPLPALLPPPALNPYTRRVKLWRVYSYIATYIVMYIRVHGRAAVYSRDSRTRLYLRMSWIYRARALARIAEHEVYSLCHYRRLAEFRALSVQRYVMRMSLVSRRSASFRFDIGDLNRARARARVTSIFI